MIYNVYSNTTSMGTIPSGSQVSALGHIAQDCTCCPGPFNSFKLSGLIYHNSMDRSIPYIRSIRLVFIITLFYIFSICNANSVEPNQMPQNVASDLGLCCLPMSLLWDAWIKRVKLFTIFNIHILRSEQIGQTNVKILFKVPISELVW